MRKYLNILQMLPNNRFMQITKAIYFILYIYIYIFFHRKLYIYCAHGKQILASLREDTPKKIVLF